MDTWSALLLCHDSKKIDPSTELEFSSSSETPAYLLEFKGSVAERHVENIKAMRTIGAKRYIEACRGLSDEETLLRQKVYNFYHGPGIFRSCPLLRQDCFYWPTHRKVEGVSTWFGKGIVPSYFTDGSACYSFSIHAGLVYSLLNNCQVMTYDESASRITIDTLNEIRVYVKQNESDEVRRRKCVREALRGLDVRLTRNLSNG
jgi:hypothetical protein